LLESIDILVAGDFFHDSVVDEQIGAREHYQIASKKQVATDLLRNQSILVGGVNYLECVCDHGHKQRELKQHGIPGKLLHDEGILQDHRNLVSNAHHHDNVDHRKHKSKSNRRAVIDQGPFIPGIFGSITARHQGSGCA
jgi:hypothetical protein